MRPDELNRYDTSVLSDICSSFSNPLEMQLSEINKFELPHLLRYENRNSMHSGVEVRVPFLDHRLVEYAVGLKLDKKIHQGWMKYPIRKYLSQNGLSSIAWRKIKYGFEAPKDFWLANSKQSILHEITSSALLSNFVDVDEVSRKIDEMPINIWWRYYSFALWARVFRVQ